MSREQYDSFADTWESTRVQSSSRINSDGVKNELGKLPPSTSILELACGTGFFTQHALDCGASNIVALDISPKMIEVALETFPAKHANRAWFHVANCADPALWEKVDALKEKEGTFDIVLAGWLLNYAATENELRNMFINIRTALKPRGRFIGTTVPVNRIDQYKSVPGTTRVNEPFPGVVMHNIGNVEGGYKMRNEHPGNITYYYYFFGPEVYERAAKAAGLRLEWKDLLPSKALVDEFGEAYFQAHNEKVPGALCQARM